MGQQVARALLNSGLKELLVVNRTYERAVEVASTFGGTAVPWERFSDYLPRADVVITSTGATRPIFGATDRREAIERARTRQKVRRAWEPLLLWASRQAFVDGTKTPLSRATALLSGDYVPTAFWWEPLEMCRKLTLTGWVLLIPETKI